MMRVKTVLEAYRKHVEERAAQGVVPQPLNAEQTAGLVELLSGRTIAFIDGRPSPVNRPAIGIDHAAIARRRGRRIDRIAIGINEQAIVGRPEIALLVKGYALFWQGDSGFELFNRAAGHRDFHECGKGARGGGAALQAGDGAGIVTAHPDARRQPARKAQEPAILVRCGGV